jgi:hypothetical protein
VGQEHGTGLAISNLLQQRFLRVSERRSLLSKMILIVDANGAPMMVIERFLTQRLPWEECT